LTQFLTYSEQKGCGGTTLNYNGKSLSSLDTYKNETAWSNFNGGFSKAFSRPAYQTGFQTKAFMGVPDLSANADPNSGYKICYAKKCRQVGGWIFFLLD
jgi:kumamolisin